jgi:hypothetical protein
MRELRITNYELRITNGEWKVFFLVAETFDLTPLHPLIY